MQSRKSSKSKPSNANGQKTLHNFFIKQEREDQEKCSSCGENYLASKISFHRDFECVVVDCYIKSSSYSADTKPLKKSKLKCKVNKRNMEVVSTKKSKSKYKLNKCNVEIVSTNSDVIILDDVDDNLESTFSPDNKRCASPNLFDIDEIMPKETHREKISLIEKLKKDWDSPSNSPVKPPVQSMFPVSPKITKTDMFECEKIKPIKSSDFSILSSTDSENEFEKHSVVYSPAPRNISRKKKKHSINSAISSDTDVNLTIKSENPVLLTETSYINESNLSCEDILLNSPALVSPERTPTPSPDKSVREKIQTVDISSQILSSPHRFSLKKKLSDLQNEEMEVKINIAADRIKLTPLKIFNSIKKSNFKNGYLPSNSFPVRRDLFSRTSDNPNESPTKKKATNSPNKYRNEKGMYLDNFLNIIGIVKSQPQDILLFSDDDLKCIHDFYQLTLQAQKLYVRFFQRKLKWNKVSKIEYKEICDKEDTSLYINELVYAEFLLAESHLTNLKDLLTLLDVNNIRKVCKDMKLQTSGTKENLIAKLIKSDQEQTSMSTFCKSKHSESQIVKMARDLIGKCFILQKEVWNVFMRILHLYSPTHFEEDEENGQQAQLTALLMVSIGKMHFPDYSIIREHSIYRSRDDLIRFQTFMQMEYEIQEHMKCQKWDEAVEVCKQVEQIFSEIENDDEMLKHDASLPSYLRRFTTQSLMCHIRTMAVEIYQRQKNYGKAVKQLEQLLAQKTHRQDCRGRWYDRLALNLHPHLKSPAKALHVIKEALEDPEVRVGHRLSLSQRAERLLNSKAFQKYAAEYENKLLLMEFQEAPRVYIQGKCLPADIPGYKRIFISSEERKDTTLMCSVEELALNHYKTEGYPKGLHSEGRVIAALFGFFFWDIIYLSIPDVFRTRHQAAPLDLDSPEFYTQRKKAIDRRLKEMKKWTLDEANKVIEKVWMENENSVSLIDWKLFSSLELLKGLIAGLGLEVISAICERLAKDHRCTRSGFPDLVVWNPLEKKSRIVEVKGPNDKLSTKQMLWLDFLISNGAVAEVCHVEAVGQKRTGALKSKRISPKKRKTVAKTSATTSPEMTSEVSPKKATQKRTRGVKRKLK